MNKSIPACLLLLGSLAFNTVMASVTVEVKEEQYAFEHQPWLVEVLAPIALQQNWYWPSATLYRLGDDQLEETRKLLLSNLSTIIELYSIKNPKTAQSLQQLQTTIKNWRLAQRLPIKVDYDLARLVPAENPQLPQGNYLLSITPRMNTVQVFGAVNKTHDLPHLAHSDASQYITKQNILDLADKDIVIIIQADGRNITAPVAYWNKAHQEVMPGSQIFVPFKESLFNSEFASINQQIIDLSLNRVQQ